MHEVGGVGLLRIEREVWYGVWMSLAWLCDAAERLAYLGCVTLSNGDCWVGGECHVGEDVGGLGLGVAKVCWLMQARLSKLCHMAVSHCSVYKL